jgi:hypothetical protein
VKLTGDRCRCSGPPYGGCGEYFNSTKAFDRHRTGAYALAQRRCLSPDEMRAKGMAKNAAGFWVTELHTGSSLRRRLTAAPIDPTPSPDSPPGEIPADTVPPARQVECSP